MSFKIVSEAQILDEATRKRIIEEIQGPENQRRKAEAFRRYECFKDRTDIYVLEDLLRQMDEATVMEMQYALTNISFTRKIIDKLARVYNPGVKRSIHDNEAATADLESVAKILKFNQTMKKTNRLLKLEHNCALYIRPIPSKTELGKFDLKPSPLAPFLYDVIEDPQDAEKPMVFILSSYSPQRTQQYYALDAAAAGRTHIPLVRQTTGAEGDGLNQAIADAPFDGDSDEFIWWSPSFHFTTNCKGQYVNEIVPDHSNPIKMLPFVNFATDQDDNFWAQGGKDLADSGIKINALLTHLAHIAVTQGYGQLYMTGDPDALPKSVKTGVNHCIQLAEKEGGAKPQVGYLTANPPIGDLVKLVEMYIALLLSTNNLSTTGFASSLQGGAGLPSGIALMIDKAESIEDVEDQSEIFRDGEPDAWAIIAAWMQLYGSRQLLSERLVKYKIPLRPEVVLRFNETKTIESEQDKLNIIEKRRDLGLNTMIELLMRDDPSLTEESAKDKLAKILEEKLQRALEAQEQMAEVTGNSMDGGEQTSEEDQKSQENGTENQDQPPKNQNNE
jgi:hypothetical protein